MSDNIFRKKSLDKISSPEEIDEYMKVTRPSTWIVLGAIILLLIAAIIWIITGKLQTTIEAEAKAGDVQVTAYVTNDEMSEQIAY